MINQDLLVRILAKNETAQAFGQLNNSLNSLRQQVLGVVSALAGGLAFRDIIDSTRKWGHEVDQLQDQLGGTAEDMSKLNFIGQSVGLTTDELSQTFGILSKRIADSVPDIIKGTSEFDKWGIKLQDAQGHIVGFDEAMRRIRTRFQEVGQNAQGTALLLDLFGRSGKSLSDFLSLTDPQLRQLIQTAQDFGMVLDQAGKQRLEDFNRKLYIFQLQVEGIKMAIGNALLPVLSAMLDRIRQAAGFFKALGEAIGRAAGPLKEFIDRAGGVKAIADALIYVGVGLIGLAAVGALIALIGFLLQLAAIAVPLVLVAGGILAIANAILNTRDPVQKFIDILGGLQAITAGVALALLFLNHPVAAVVVAAFSLIIDAIKETMATIALIHDNWDKFVYALMTGQLNDIPVFGFFFHLAENFIKWIDNMKTALQGFLDALIRSDWGDVFGRLVSAALTRLGPLGQMLQGIWDLIQRINSTPVNTGGSGGGGGGGGGGAWAEGGIITRPTYGLVGEAGPEAVIPLSRPGALGAVGALGTTVNIYVSDNVTRSEQELAEKVSDVFMRQFTAQRNASF